MWSSIRFLMKFLNNYIYIWCTKWYGICCTMWYGIWCTMWYGALYDILCTWCGAFHCWVKTNSPLKSIPLYSSSLALLILKVSPSCSPHPKGFSSLLESRYTFWEMQVVTGGWNPPVTILQTRGGQKVAAQPLSSQPLSWCSWTLPWSDHYQLLIISAIFFLAILILSCPPFSPISLFSVFPVLAIV